MACIDDFRPSNFGSGESESDPAFKRGGFATGPLTAEEEVCESMLTGEQTLGEKAEQATEAIGVGMEKVGKSIREHAPDHGVLGNAGRAVGDKIEAGGQYLESHGLQGMCDDVTQAIRSNPIPALCVAFGIGFLAVRLFRR